MEAEFVKYSEGLKFVWDGADYPSAEAAAEKRAQYEKDGFSVFALANDGKHFLYTRRVVKDVVVAPS